MLVFFLINVYVLLLLVSLRVTVAVNAFVSLSEGIVLFAPKVTDLVILRSPFGAYVLFKVTILIVELSETVPVPSLFVPPVTSPFT